MAPQPFRLAESRPAAFAPPGLRLGGRGGFSLVEMAVVLVIMGIIGWFFYGPLFELSFQEKTGQAERDLRTVESALKGLVAVNATLPNPRSKGSVAAYPAAGLLPTGVPLTRDPWGQDILYFEARELDGMRSIKNVLSTRLQVRIYRDVGSGGSFPAADAALEREVTNLAFVLLSRGKNMQGQATVTTSGGVTTINLLKAGGPMQDGSGVEYDDLVRFVSLHELVSLAGD